MKRVRKGKCDADLTAPYGELLQNLESIGSACMDLADQATSTTPSASTLALATKPSLQRKYFPPASASADVLAGFLFAGI